MIGGPLSDDSVPTRSASTRDAAQPSVFDAETPLARLLAGNQRFVAGKPRFGHHVDAPGARNSVQHPWACVIGCLDSRVPPEAVLDQDFGSIMVVRTGGHVLDEAGIGSVEFAVEVCEVPLVVVLGHQYCGAVTSAVRALDSGNRPGGALDRLVDEIAPAIDPGDDPAHRVDRAIDRHVARTVSMLSELAFTRERIAAGALEIVGARYQIDTGRVAVLG